MESHRIQCNEAAYEAISSVNLRSIGKESFIDVRSTKLPTVRPEYDDFDPRLHRQPKAPIQVWMAYFNLLRTGFGAGMLGMPLAISQVGIVLGPALSIAIGILLIHQHWTLLWSLNEVSRQLRIPYISYRYGFRIALLRGPGIFHPLGHCGPVVIAIFMIISQLGICTVYIIFTADSLRDLMDWQSAKTSLCTLLLPYIILELSMKSLKYVSYISMIGNLMNVIGLILVFYHIFRESRGESYFANTSALPFLFAVGSILFNISGVGVVLSLDKALIDPKVLTDRCGVINIGLGIIAIFATLVGTFGYWTFGTLEENILRSLPFVDKSAQASIGLYLVAVAFAYPIQCYPALQIILEVIKNYKLDEYPSDNTLKLIEFIFRPVFVISTFTVAYLVPFQGPFVAFVGNLCTSMLALVFPALMELSLLYPDQYGPLKIFLIKDVLIVLVGIICWTFGAFLSGYLIYIRMLSLQSPNNSDYL